MKNMKKLAAVLLTAIPSSALADPWPWFDQQAAERLVAERLPAYQQNQLDGVEARDPDLYLQRLHSGVAMLREGERSPELLRAWQAHWRARQQFHDRTVQWLQNPLARTPAARVELEIQAEETVLSWLEYLYLREQKVELRLVELHQSIDELENTVDQRVEQKVERFTTD